MPVFSDQNLMKPVIVRQVWASNADYEFGLIRKIVPRFPFITMDTEFPGVVYRPTADALLRSPEEAMVERYRVLKQNVDAMKLIQLGFTFSDSKGNLPDFGTQNRFIWEFNFSGFDVSSDLHAPESMELLMNQGIDFEKHRADGIDPTYFAHLMFGSGLVMRNPMLLRWITFHGTYDFAYLIKVLTQRELPQHVVQFYGLLRLYFGPRVYDVKVMARFCEGLYGGLERIGRSLGVEREVGKSHCAGSDSLLTWQVFEKISQIYFVDYSLYVGVTGVLFGLELSCKPGSAFYV